MSHYSRREFLGKVGTGMLVSAGGLLAVDELELLGLVHAGTPERLNFGGLEPLVTLMQDTSADGLIPKLKQELDGGTELRTLVIAAALANARTFGGQDYTGYHCFMALVPSLAMSARLDGAEAALPIFKVLHRNTTTMQGHGGSRSEVLRPVKPADKLEQGAERFLLAAGRNSKYDAAEAALAREVGRNPAAAFEALQPLVRDNIDVHQVVLAFRSWDMRELTGEHNAGVLLRQVLRQCIDRDDRRRSRGRPAPSIRELLPALIEQHGLDRETAAGKPLTQKQLDELAQFIFAADRDDAARHVAARLAAGVSRADVSEALSLAAVRLLLHDPGRSHGSKGKPEGSVHGASVGLHACDSANAWRGIAASTGAANANASLVTAAWHAAGQSGRMDTDQPFHASVRPEAAKVSEDKLIPATVEAMRGGDQRRAAALAERYGKIGGNPEPLIAELIRPAIAHDGALHHEKFFLTATEEFARSRSDLRWDHLVALTRVMASGQGFEAEGLELSRSVLGV